MTSGQLQQILNNLTYVHLEYAETTKHIAAAKDELTAKLDALSALLPTPIDVEALATAIAAKLQIPAIDVDALATAVAAKLQIPAIDLEAIANAVADELHQRGAE